MSKRVPTPSNTGKNKVSYDRENKSTTGTVKVSVQTVKIWTLSGINILVKVIAILVLAYLGVGLGYQIYTFTEKKNKREISSINYTSCSICNLN